jgi:hypothetical protein
MLVATALFGIFIVFDLGINDVSFYSLTILGNKFVAATSDVQKTSYLAAADLANASLAGGFLLHGIPLSIATIIVGSVMLKGIFSKRTAYLGIIAGIVGLIGYPFTALSGLGLPLLIFGIAASTWLISVSFKLYRL